MKTKEEILKAAQQNQDTASFKGRKRDDERAQAIRYQSFRTAWIAEVIALIAFSVLTMLNDQPWENMFAVLGIMEATALWIQYSKLKERRTCFGAIVMTLCALWFSVMTVLTMLGMHSPASIFH